MTLMDLSLENVYRSSSHLLGRDFLASLLSASSVYRRAAGFFASSVFSVSPNSWIKFFENAGRFRVVTSHLLPADDIYAIERAVVKRPLVRKEFSLEEFCENRLSKADGCTALLAGLIATDCMDIRIAVIEKQRSKEIYHEKIGAFTDEDGGLVAFSGSANETRTAYALNFERVDVFSTGGQRDDRRRAYAISNQFDDLWANKTPGVRVFSITDALKKGLLDPVEEYTENEDTASREESRTSPGGRSPEEVLVPASRFEPRDHQRAAIRAWAKAGGRGFLEMATGSGKTITALTLASRLYDSQGGPFAILIVAPLIHLVDQWRSVSMKYGLNPVRCVEGLGRWHVRLGAAIDGLLHGDRDVLSIATSGATMQSQAFRDLIGRIRCPFLVIADEVHNYGSSANFAALPDNANLRIGLSATPDRAYDTAGNERLRGYFGETVYKYGLREALDDGVLTPYRYHPVVVELADEEIEEYVSLSESIARYSRGSDEDSPVSEAVKRLLIRRARLIATAQAKLPRLRSLLTERRDEKHILVYCGDGTVEGPEGEVLVRQVDEVVRMIGSSLRMRCARYTAETPPRRRQQLLEQFAEGEIQVLIAIRCLDEGVDVPATRTAFMIASSTNPRQFIQRRGRVLRNSPGKRRAEVFDFFVSFPPSAFYEGHPQFKTARGLVERQLSRVEEFADLAENGSIARNELLDLRKHYHLLSKG